MEERQREYRSTSAAVPRNNEGSTVQMLECCFVPSNSAYYLYLQNFTRWPMEHERHFFFRTIVRTRPLPRWDLRVAPTTLRKWDRKALESTPPGDMPLHRYTDVRIYVFTDASDTTY